MYNLNIEMGRLRGRPAPDKNAFLQMDIGGLPREHFLESLNLLATEVKPALPN